QFAAQEPRFDEIDQVILLFGPDRGAQADFLAGAGKIRRIEQVTVALADFHEADQAFNRSKAGPYAHAARVLLRDLNDEVAPVRHIGRLGLNFDLFKKIQTLQTKLAALHLDHIEDFPGRDRQLTPDNAV